MIETFFKLLIGHAVGDFWAQSEAMRQAKGWTAQIKSGDVLVWPYALTAHALMHGGAVWLLTGNVWLGFAEVVCHWCIDYGKCSHWYNVHVDQSAHIACKMVWAVLA